MRSILLSEWTNRVEFSGRRWTMGVAIQLVSMLAAIVALFLIWFQLKYQSKQMKFEALTQLHEILISPSMQDALRFVYSEEPIYLANPKTPGELEKVELVLNTYDLIGLRVREGLLPEETTLVTEWGILLRVQGQLQPFIEQERMLRNGVPFKENYEWLVKRAKEFRNERYPKCDPRPFKRQFTGTGS